MSSDGLTRGEFLGAGLKAGAALWLGAHVLPIATAKADLPAPDQPMIKALNTVFYEDHDVRSFVRAGNVGALVLWAPLWSRLEPEPGHHDESQWENFDKVIKNAREDKCPVYVAVSSAEVPKWSLPAPKHAPIDRTPTGSYAQYLRSIMTRHPHIEGILPLNEPDQAFIGDGQAAAKTAELIRTADEILNELHYPGLLLVPATSDEPGFYTYTEEVLRQLKGWHPASNVAWANHVYSDVKENSHRRAEAVLDLQGRWQWVGGRLIWVSEGGYKFDTRKIREPDMFDYVQPLAGQEKAQVRNVPNHFRWARDSGRVAMWANYIYRDLAKGGGGFMSGLVRINGKPHPLLREWRELTVANPPVN